MRKTLELLAVAVVLAAAAGCGGSPSTEPMPPGARTLAIAPDFAGTLWAALGPDAYRTLDGGRSWTRVESTRGSGDGVAFTESYAFLVGPRGGAVADFGGTRSAPLHRTPAWFVSVASPYHKTNRLYALDRQGGLWLSVTAGRSWSRLRADGLPPGCVAVAAVRDLVTEPDIVYAACGSGGLWRSLDLGASFQRVAGIADARSVALTTDDQDLVLVAAGDGIHLSTDRGASFDRTSSAVASAVAFDPRNRRLAYAAVGDRLLRSVDGGATWPQV